MSPRSSSVAAGGRGSPGKNIRTILGRPALHYPLLAARASGIVSETWISTDADEIIEAARPFGAKPIRRPPELATAEAPLEAAIDHARMVVESSGPAPDLYLILLANAVTVRPEPIREARSILARSPETDSATTGARWNMFSPMRARRREIDGISEPFLPLDQLARHAPLSSSRDKSGDCWFCDNAFTLVRRDALARIRENPLPFPWMGMRIHLLEQRPGGGDIDLSWQIAVVEDWLRAEGFSETTLPYKAK